MANIDSIYRLGDISLHHCCRESTALTGIGLFFLLQRLNQMPPSRENVIFNGGAENDGH